MGIEFHVFGYFLGCFFGVGWVCGEGCRMHRCQKPTAQGASSGFYVFGYAVLYFSSRLLGLPKGVGRQPKQTPAPRAKKPMPPVGPIDKLASAFLPYVLNLGAGFPNLNIFQMGWLVQPTREMDGGSVIFHFGICFRGRHSFLLSTIINHHILAYYSRTCCNHLCSKQ